MHKSFMLAALEQAQKGRGCCAPNPAVGAVLVHDGQIVAAGWHEGAGKPHAELNVLAEVASASGMSLYVTLEPCNHWGKTPPCVTSIINSGVSTVIYGFRDPNPLVAENNTPRILEEAGIAVIYTPLPEIDDFYASYLYWTQTQKPWLTAKIAQSLDARIANPDGSPRQLTNALVQQFTHRQRLQSDLILTTAKTILKDNPSLNVRLGDTILKKPIAILDRSLSLLDTPNAKIFDTAAHCHIFYDEHLEVPNKQEHCTYHPVPVIQGQLDMPSVLLSLGSLGFHDVWVEAGGTLFSSLHQAGLVQTTFIYIAAHVLGPKALPAYLDDQFFNRPFTILWQIEGDNVIACLQWQKE